MTTNRDWLFSLPLEEQYAWMNAEHQDGTLDGDTAALEAEYGKGGVVGGSFLDTPEQGEVVMPLQSWREYLGTEPENADSRELLEADAFAYLQTAYITYPQIIELLDRQAAITSHQWESYHNGMMREWMAKTEELQAKVDELTAERDNLADDLLIANKQREWYREKFGKCLDYADAIHALMDDEGMA